MFTAATAPADLKAGVRAMLFNAVVFAPGEKFPDFGLAKSFICALQPNSSSLRKLGAAAKLKEASPTSPRLLQPHPGEEETGGWLRKGKMSTKAAATPGKGFGETLYFVINDTRGYFCPIRNGELIEDDLVQFHKIVYCTMFYHQDTYFFQLGWVSAGGKLRQCDFAPANTKDRDLVMSWTCALQIRSKTYDPQLDVDRERAVKLALWLQSTYRGMQGRRIAERRRQRALAAKQGRLTKLVSGLLYDQPSEASFVEDDMEREGGDSTSSGEEEDLDLVDPKDLQQVKTLRKSSTAGATASSYFNMTKALIFPKRSAVVVVGSPTKDTESTRSFRSLSLTSQQDLTPAAEQQEQVDSTIERVEDEIWENQRWQTIAIRGTTQARGWSEIALLITDRGPYSDRRGLISFPNLASIGVPSGGWEVTQNWHLAAGNTSSSQKCNSEGWTYATTFGSLDANLASGRECSSVSPRWLVRRRRWVRVRQRTAPTDDKFAISGWLGMQGIMTGRWTNNFAFIPAKARQRSAPAFCIFKDSVCLYDHSLEFRIDLNSISKRDAKIKHLDSQCRVSDAVASQDRPGLFVLHLTGEAEPRVLNAFTAEARTRWVSQLRECIAESPQPDYGTIVNRRSMRKGAVWEFSRASGAVKGVVGEVKTRFKRVIISSNNAELHTEDSDPDSHVITQLREEFRKNPEQQQHSAKLPADDASLGGDGDESSGKALMKPSTSAIIQSTPNVLKNFKLPSKRNKPMGIPPIEHLAPTLNVADGGDAALSPPTSPSSITGPFEVPPMYENIVFDGYFDMSVDDFDTVMFREEDYTRDILDFEKMTDVELEPWTNGILPGSEHRRKYKMPRVGVVPPGPSLHLLTRVQTCPGQGYVVDHVVSTPDVPFGTTFNNEFRYVMTAEGAQRMRMVISHKVTIHKPSMAQSFIRSGTKREIGNYYKGLYTTFTRKWLAQKRGHLMAGGAVAATAAQETETAAPAKVVEQEVEVKQVESRGWLMWTVVVLLLLMCALLLVQTYMLAQRMERLEEWIAREAVTKT